MAEIDKPLPNVNTEIKVPGEEEIAATETEVTEDRIPSPDDIEVTQTEDGGAEINFEPGAVNQAGTGAHFDNLADLLPEDVFFLYYPNENEQQTRVVEFKKLTRHKSPNTLITMEVPSMKNKLYPTMIKSEVDKAQKYIDALPENIKSVGRMGTYRYVDIDDIILQGLEFKKNL